MYNLLCTSCFGQITQSDLIKTLQAALGRWGYTDTGSPGVWSKKIGTALKAFQTAQGLPKTGTPEYWTLNTLVERDLGMIVPFPDWATLYKQATGKTPVEETWQVQYALRRLDFNPGPVDGAMGNQTRTAIKAWQKVKGVPQTGTLDTAMRDRLISEALEAPIPLGTELIVGTVEPAEVTQVVREAASAGIPVETKTDPGVVAPKVVIERDPATAQIIRVTKLVPGKPVSPWVWVGLAAVGVVAVGGVVTLIVRAYKRQDSRRQLGSPVEKGSKTVTRSCRLEYFLITGQAGGKGMRKITAEAARSYLAGLGSMAFDLFQGDACRRGEAWRYTHLGSRGLPIVGARKIGG